MMQNSSSVSVGLGGWASSQGCQGDNFMDVSNASSWCNHGYEIKT